MMLDKVKQADRVTFMINYLYMTLRNNQLLEKGTEIVSEMFEAAVDSYVDIMAEWVTLGELKDENQEFFIRYNPKILEDDKDKKVSSKV
jgi:hypothetical protein